MDPGIKGLSQADLQALSGCSTELQNGFKLQLKNAFCHKCMATSATNPMIPLQTGASSVPEKKLDFKKQCGGTSLLLSCKYLLRICHVFQQQTQENCQGICQPRWEKNGRLHLNKYSKLFLSHSTKENSNSLRFSHFRKRLRIYLAQHGLLKVKSPSGFLQTWT